VSTLLIQHARLLVTMDSQRHKIADGRIFVRDNVIEAVEPTNELPREAERIIDASGHL
jgi:8-oxoguanine deaminase